MIDSSTWSTLQHRTSGNQPRLWSTIHLIVIGYFLDMKMYVQVLVRSNNARRQERNINYAPERVHLFPYPTNKLLNTYALLSQKASCQLLYNFHQQNLKNSIWIKQAKIKFKTKVNQLLPLLFLRLSRNINVYSKEFHSYIWEHMQIFICNIYV